MDIKTEKLQRFASDHLMKQAVFDVLVESYVKQSKSQDVQYLAASRIAIDLLHDAWKELSQYQPVDKPLARGGVNSGL